MSFYASFFSSFIHHQPHRLFSCCHNSSADHYVNNQYNTTIKYNACVGPTTYFIYYIHHQNTHCFFRLASACETCKWVSEISANFFPNRRFHYFKRASHLMLCMKSQLATNKEYFLNRYHNHSSERKLPFTSIKR